MSVVALIEFDWDASWTTSNVPTQKEAEAFINVPGLQWKIWINDEKTRQLGGVYLFSSRNSAEEFLASIVEKLRKKYAHVRARVLEIDEISSRITHAPLDGAPAVAAAQLAG